MLPIQLWVAIAIATLAFPGTVLAGEGCGGDLSVVEHIFLSADGDGSGSLSPAEYAAAGLEGFGVSFAESDANRDGEISLAEYVALYERHHPGGDRLDL